MGWLGKVAASNAGGAGSVIGDTTTTMLWIHGVSPLAVLDAFIASAAAFAVFGPLVSLQQQRHSPIIKDISASTPGIDWPRGIIVLTLFATIFSVNLAGNAFFPGVLDAVPLLGAGLWIAILSTALWRRPDWSVVPSAAKGAVFLVSLVAAASMMPVERLPTASWQTAFGLGILSAGAPVRLAIDGPWRPLAEGEIVVVSSGQIVPIALPSSRSQI